MKQKLRKSALRMMARSGVAGLCAPLLRGRGVIYMLHHIRPGRETADGFEPNAGLTITPDFLNEVIQFTRKSGYDIVSLAEAVNRLETEENGKPFAAFSIDDGYLDNLEYALPVFAKEETPVTVFVSPGIIDGTCELWWLGLEEVLKSQTSIDVTINDHRISLFTRNTSEKQKAFEALYWPLRNLDEKEQRRWVTQFCKSYGVDLRSICRCEAMTWDQLRAFAANPLVTIGAHTINHLALAKLSAEEALNEAVSSRERLQSELKQLIDFFAYPYGDPSSAGLREFDLIKNAGFKAAVTTRKGVLFSQHKHHLTALPRLSLNGDFQDLGSLEALLSGAPFALHNRFRKVNVG